MKYPSVAVVAAVCSALLLAPARVARSQPEAPEATQPAPASAEDDGVVSLQEALALARRHAPSLDVEAADIDIAQARELEAQFARLPELSARSAWSPSGPVRGNAIDSTSRTDIGAIADLTEELGFQTSNSLRATMPIYTFGKIAIARDLASVGFEVAVLERQKAELELVFDVHRAYYSYQLALALQELIDEATGRLEEVRESLETRLDEGDRGARTELRQLTIYEADMAGRVADHRLLLNLARAGLRYYCGLEGAYEVTPFDDDLPETRLDDLDRFLELAREHRPDLALLEFGVEARELQADFAWRQIVPNLFVAVGFNFNYNPLADNQPSPFAYDPYNSSGIGFVVGMDWRMDFRQIAQARRADAEADRMSAQRRQAIGGIEIEVEQAYYEALGQEDRAVAEYEAFRAARAWFRQKMIQFDSGLADFDDLRDPLVAYFSAWGNYYQALYEMRLAQANLALKAGLEGLELGTGLVEADD